MTILLCEGAERKTMSIQTDVEMLSLRAMETYAKRNHLSGEDVTELCHKCQVFEKL